MSDVKLENVELKEEEVNIYTPDCGVTRKACTTDCFYDNLFNYMCRIKDTIRKEQRYCNRLRCSFNR